MRRQEEWWFDRYAQINTEGQSIISIATQPRFFLYASYPVGDVVFPCGIRHVCTSAPTRAVNVYLILME